MKKKKKERKPFVDDGHTVFNMDGVGGAHHTEQDTDDLGMTRAERRAAIRAALIAYLPVLGIVLLCFFVTMIAMYFWLMK